MKKIQLSKRLKFVADFITPGYVLADIGTDHGFIPIYLVQEGKVPKALAMDINEGPLGRADEHIEEACLTGKIETRLSDGLEKLCENEAESILIAGMGGALTVKILSEGKHALKGVKELVLSPHTEADTVREFLRETDFVIEREGMVIDAGKYYVVIKAKRMPDGEGKGVLYTTDKEGIPDGVSLELYNILCIKFGRMLLKEKNGVLKEFLLKEKNTYSIILGNLISNMTSTGSKRKEEVEEILKQINVALDII